MTSQPNYPPPKPQACSYPTSPPRRPPTNLRGSSWRPPTRIAQPGYPSSSSPPILRATLRAPNVFFMAKLLERGVNIVVHHENNIADVTKCKRFPVLGLMPKRCRKQARIEGSQFKTSRGLIYTLEPCHRRWPHFWLYLIRFRIFKNVLDISRRILDPVMPVHRTRI